MAITKVKLPVTYNIYADGSSINNPGPSGSAAIVVNNGEFKNARVKHLGQSTNGRAEIIAIFMGLQMIEALHDTNVIFVIFSDSQYALHVLFDNYNYKANIELIDEIKKYIKELKDKNIVFRHVWIKGHITRSSRPPIYAYHEVADNLAGLAARKNNNISLKGFGSIKLEMN